MGLVCIQNSSLLVYSKSQKVSASYCLPFRHSRGKNQPVGGFRPPPPPACLGLSENKSLNENVNKLTQEKISAKPSIKPNENDPLIKMSNEIIELRKEVNSLSEVNREITYQLAELQDSYNKQVELNKSLEKKITSQCESVDNLITSNDNKPVPRPKKITRRFQLQQ